MMDQLELLKSKKNELQKNQIQEQIEDGVLDQIEKK